MAITYHFQVEDNLLSVEASGFDEDAEEVVNYGLAIIRKAIEKQCALVLCDERELEYRIGTLDTYMAAEFIASQAPKVARVAIVCRPHDLKDGKFYETVAVNRGLQIRAFEDIDVARQWLENQG